MQSKTFLPLFVGTISVHAARTACIRCSDVCNIYLPFGRNKDERRGTKKGGNSKLIVRHGRTLIPSCRHITMVTFPYGVTRRSFIGKAGDTCYTRAAPQYLDMIVPQFSQLCPDQVPVQN